MPTFYGFIDGQNVSKRYEDLQEINESTKVFFTRKTPYDKQKVDVLLQKDNFYEFLQKDCGHWEAYAKKMPQGFSSDIEKEVYWGYTCAYSMMQIIAYLGFKEVYLLGMDCIYAPNTVNYCDWRDDRQIKQGNFGGGTVVGFIKAWEQVKEYADQNNIKVYNATRGGMLEVFERVDLDLLLDLRNGD